MFGLCAKLTTSISGFRQPRPRRLRFEALTVELGQLARANGFDALGYILDMARLEADEASKGSAERGRWLEPAKSLRSS
jgi:hypothetical protein